MTDLATRIRALVAEMLPCDHDPRDDESLADRDADDRDALALEQAVSRTFNVTIPDLYPTTTIAELIASVEGAGAGRTQMEVF